MSRCFDARVGVLCHIRCTYSEQDEPSVSYTPGDVGPRAVQSLQLFGRKLHPTRIVEFGLVHAVQDYQAIVWASQPACTTKLPVTEPVQVLTFEVAYVQADLLLSGVHVTLHGFDKERVPQACGALPM